MVRAALLTMAVIGTVAVPAPVLACQPSPSFKETTPSVVEHARSAVRSATAIVDAEVEVTGGGAADHYGWAVLKVIRVWKGAPAARVRVTAPDDCSVSFWLRGGQYRVVLQGGPNTYSAGFSENGLLLSHKGLEQFNREVDRLVGSPRAQGLLFLQAEYPTGFVPPQPLRRPR